MTALIEKIASTSFAKKLAHFLIPHSGNDHHPILIRHESLFAITFIILAVQFFSFGSFTGAQVLGYGTNIDRETIITLTNQERTSRDLAALKESNKLDNSATMKGQDMFNKDYWAHFAPDGTSPWYFFKQAGYDYSWAGENLARDFDTSDGVVAGWMASQSHRENMLNPNFVDIGISVQNGTLGGEQTTLVVEHLGRPMNLATDNTQTVAPVQASAQPAQVQDNLKKTQVPSPLVSTSSANPKVISEKIASNIASTSLDLASYWKGLGVGQKITAFLLMFLFMLFAFDSILIFKKGIARRNSHSLLHAGVLAILIVALIRSAAGGVL